MQRRVCKLEVSNGRVLKLRKESIGTAPGNTAPGNIAFVLNGVKGTIKLQPR